MGKKCVIGEYCSQHGFIHGAEAEELREKLEELLKYYDPEDVPAHGLRRLLEDVDARDSLAWLDIKDRDVG